MRGLASFVMRGRFQAVLVVVLATLLPLLNIFSGAAVALVTLHHGAREGINVTLLASAALAVLFVLLYSSMVPVIGVLCLFWLPLWMLGSVLRATISLATTLQVALLMTALAMLGYAIYLGDASAWGRTLLEQVLVPFLEQTGLTDDPATTAWVIDVMAPLILGLLFANGLTSVLCGLLLGRWWQSLLYNPGGFRDEFHQLRLGPQMALAAAVVFGLALFTDMALVVNLALVTMVVYALQGIALVHGVVGKTEMSRGWLVGFYVLMLFALPQMVTLLCLLAVIDAWADFRARVRPRPRMR